MGLLGLMRDPQQHCHKAEWLLGLSVVHVIATLVQALACGLVCNRYMVPSNGSEAFRPFTH